MSEHIVSMPGSTDRFVITDRPPLTLTDRYRPLPAGMDHTHFTIVPAHQVRAGDIVAAFFTDGPGVRYAEHVTEAFTARPCPLGPCSTQCECEDCATCPEECETCEDTAARGLPADQYIALAAADQKADCVIVARDTPVGIVSASIAVRFPSLDSAPPLPDLFTLDDGQHGPYEALPVTRTWRPQDAIRVTRATAEQIVADLPASRAGRGIRFQWMGDWLLITGSPRSCPHPFREIVEPDADGRYRIGGLWAWKEWPGGDVDPQVDTEPDPTEASMEKIYPDNPTHDELPPTS
ncbi:hypothetical protein [Streptomyces sp. CBMA156]|uniref:hypothetical protein n=1 Tax=Streptomyces sp. CBMA156 TaxID=1930280 RepID=UPI001661BDAC|nr:hypothetical protein [Streptomyces sp. CBMA156]MBD0673979.1 hypothetical protein [Streptomyces sp. CBMA156]